MPSIGYESPGPVQSLIGENKWDSEAIQGWIANNQRFCVLPAGRIPNLASAVLARTLRRVPGDYLAVYGHRVLAVETFTDPARHTGACYAAANFTLLGQTSGYARTAGTWRHHGNVKNVWWYPLYRDLPAVLSSPFPHPLLTPGDRSVAAWIDVNALPFTGTGGLAAALEPLTDPRQPRGIRHVIVSSLVMAVAAALSNCGKSFRSVGTYVADLDQRQLERLGGRWHPVLQRWIAPHEATLRRHIKMIDADEADALIGKWVLSLLRAGRITAGQAWILIALDGKVLKGSWEELKSQQVRLFSALVHGEGVIAGQRKVPAGTTEITQVTGLIDAIAGAPRGGAPRGGAPPPASPGEDPGAAAFTAAGLDGLAFTADALHVHRGNLRGIFHRGGEFAITVKANQPGLRDAPAALFPVPVSQDPPHHASYDKGHGRIELRSIWVTPHVAGIGFPGVFQAYRIHRQTFDLYWNQIREPETVYGISTWTLWQASAAGILAANRGHWGIENREHYVRDRTFDEDRSQIRTGSSPQVMATIKNTAISILRLIGCPNIADGMEKLSRRPQHVLDLLGA
ncbi:MAG TPA: ISAs1 family transposase [Streptosporangiaceae bacterium]|nr:ISAs1 family transposase [Streptosporangiaceae bacterium]